jgi:hypothetical protein
LQTISSASGCSFSSGGGRASPQGDEYRLLQLSYAVTNEVPYSPALFRVIVRSQIMVKMLCAGRAEICRMIEM